MLIQGGVEGYRGEPSELAARLGQAPRRGRRADPEARQGRHVAVAARAARREAELRLEEGLVLRRVCDEDEDAGRAVAGRVDADRGREAPGEREFRVLDAGSSLEVASTRARGTPAPRRPCCLPRSEEGTTSAQMPRWPQQQCRRSRRHAAATSASATGGKSGGPPAGRVSAATRGRQPWLSICLTYASASAGSVYPPARCASHGPAAASRASRTS